MNNVILMTLTLMAVAFSGACSKDSGSAARILFKDQTGREFTQQETTVPLNTAFVLTVTSYYQTGGKPHYFRSINGAPEVEITASSQVVRVENGQDQDLDFEVVRITNDLFKPARRSGDRIVIRVEINANATPVSETFTIRVA